MWCSSSVVDVRRPPSAVLVARLASFPWPARFGRHVTRFLGIQLDWDPISIQVSGFEQVYLIN
jgi:hypothetical protein